ncbi:hypothetical protein DFQ29_000720, partial [Apophysomyces sp. BC1021]
YDATDNIVETPVLQPDTTFTIDPTDIIVFPLPQQPPCSDIVATPTPTPISCKPSPRTYGEAVLYSCQQQHACDEEKINMLCLVDALALRPIAITDRQG